MTDYLTVLSGWMNQPHYMLIVLIVVYFVAATVDAVVGTINAVYTDKVQFSSRTMQLGIIRKLVTLFLMILIVPVALLLPLDIGVYSLGVMYTGIAVSEIYSIAGHAGIVKDGDKHKNLIGTIFTNFIESIYKGKGIDK
jgi:toxin secretion/phage lysis holin